MTKEIREDSIQFIGLKPHLNALYESGQIKYGYAVYNRWMTTVPPLPQTWRAKALGVSRTTMKKYDKIWKDEQRGRN